MMTLASCLILSVVKQTLQAVQPQGDANLEDSVVHLSIGTRFVTKRDLQMRSGKAIGSFGKGVAVALAGSGCFYLVCDAVSDALTLRACHDLVLPLARSHAPLVQQLGEELQTGPMFSSTMRSSPSGRLVQCQFRIDGSKRSSDVTATLQRPPYPSTAAYNIFGPASWSLQHCHVLIGGKDTQISSVDLMRHGDQPDTDSPPPQLPAHIFHQPSGRSSKS